MRGRAKKATVPLPLCPLLQLLQQLKLQPTGKWPVQTSRSQDLASSALLCSALFCHISNKMLRYIYIYTSVMGEGKSSLQVRETNASCGYPFGSLGFLIGVLGFSGQLCCGQLDTSIWHIILHKVFEPLWVYFTQLTWLLLGYLAMQATFG